VVCAALQIVVVAVVVPYQAELAASAVAFEAEAEVAVFDD
jgi:hypothetical protein